MTIEYPCRIESVANLRECWQKKARRAQGQKKVTSVYLMTNRKQCPPLPVVVTLTRIAPRLLDDDNNISGFKNVRDAVASFLALDDRDPRITWRYAQERGKSKEYAVRIAIETAREEAV